MSVIYKGNCSCGKSLDNLFNQEGEYLQEITCTNCGRRAIWDLSFPIPFELFELKKKGEKK